MDVVLGLFASAAPDERTALLVNFKHEVLGFVARVAEEALENHRHIVHEVDGVVEDDYVPRNVRFFLGLGIVDEDGAGLWHASVGDGFGGEQFGVFVYHTDEQKKKAGLEDDFR